MARTNAIASVKRRSEMAGIVVRVLDTRLGDRLYDQEPTDLIVTAQMPIAQIVGAIVGKVGGRRLDRLAIFAHGLYRRYDERLQYSHLAGVAVQLGKEDLDFSTVAEFARLKPCFAPGGQIDMFACNMAETKSADGPARSGAGLMRRLAALTGATVRTSDGVHNYRRITYLGAIDRGVWEGNIFLFRPDGRQELELVSR